MRFLAITCNPAVDTTYLLDRFTVGAINRVDRVLPAPGGKGNNVARVLAALGRAVTATGFAGGRVGRSIEDGLRVAGVVPEFVPIDGESRVCLTVVERDTGRTTEIREPGAVLGAADADRLLDHLRSLAPAFDVAILSGSLPPGLDSRFYGRAIEVLKASGLRVALDASGDALRLGLPAGPDLIAPNLGELGELLGEGPSDRLRDRAQRELIGPVLQPDAAVLLSIGAVGAALIRRDRCRLASAPEVEVVNSVGAGDALLAGFLDAWAGGASDDEALARAVGVGTATTLRDRVASIDLDDLVRLRPLVRVSAWPPTATARPSADARPSVPTHH